MMLWITVCLVVISLTGRPGFALSSTNCHCKRIFFNNVLADNRDRSEYPWQVSLGDDHWADLTLQTMNITTDHLESRQLLSNYYTDNAHKCSGIILNEKWVLTTAGCAHQKPTSIGYGSDELKRIFERVRRPVSRIVLQPIEPDHALQQLALLELGEPLYFNESVQPACLMSTDTLDRSLHDWPLSSSGWGRKAGVTLMRLQQEQIRVVTEFATNLKTIKMRMNRTLSDRCSNENLICTEPISQSGWLNEGDIGNPLYLTVESLYYVFGLAVDFEFIYANFRTSMAQQFSANLFIDLRRQMTFIQEYISPQELCIHHPPFS